ncbi:MAG: vWA domain-containing protein [Rikenellaceae bacterium]
MYERSITREHRTAFVVMIDQSGSMAELVGYEGRMMTKAAAVAEATNLIIGELMERARRQDGIRDYYDIAVVGYSGQSVRPMLSSGDDKPFISIEELSKREVKIHSRVEERLAPNGMTIPYTITTPMWVTPQAAGETPMYEGLNYAYEIVKDWCSRPANRDSFPPIIFNITDGESSDCSAEDLVKISRKIRSLSTSDGEVFMINIHIASSSHKGSMMFPTFEEVEACSHRKAKELSYASSTMPSVYEDMICELKGVVGQRNFVGVSYNASITELITILNIGTISVKRD